MINKDLIPQELIERKQWIRWQREFIPQQDRFDKIPYTIYETVKSKTNKKNLWTTFDIVNSVDTHDGIGFVFSEDDPYVFIDLDKVVNEDGTIDTFYQEILDEAKSLGGWIERSMSGTGFHIILKGEIPKADKRNPEIYSQGRFVALTFDIIHNPKEIGNGQVLLNRIHKNLNGTEPLDIKPEAVVKEDIKPKELNYKFKLPRKVYDVFEILKNKEHGESVEVIFENTGEVRKYETRSEAEGYIVMNAVTAGYSETDTYNLFNHYNVGTFSEEVDPYQYISNYYKNATYEFWKSDTRQELASIDPYTIELKYTNKRHEPNVRAVLNAILDVGIRYQRFNPYVSYRQIQEMCNIGSTKTVKNAIDKLQEEGLINIIQGSGTNESNTYEILLKGNKGAVRRNKECVSLLIYTLGRAEYLVYQMLENETLQELAQKMNRSEITLKQTLKSLIDKGFVLLKGDIYSKIEVDLSKYKDEVEYFLSEKRKKIQVEREIRKQRMIYYAKSRA